METYIQEHAIHKKYVHACIHVCVHIIYIQKYIMPVHIYTYTHISTSISNIIIVNLCVVDHFRLQWENLC